ncbi:hypothetical protein INR49_009373 [Caranx melampygus]|nr:hypothetical protein INR49_009373 [Caranx melampygus]
MRFIQRNHLERHSLTHTGMRSFTVPSLLREALALAAADADAERGSNNNKLEFGLSKLFADRPAVAASAVVPGSQCSQSREPAMLRTTPISTGTPTRTSDLEPPAPSPGPTGGLTFHLPYIYTPRQRRDKPQGFFLSALCSVAPHSSTD